MAARHSMSWVAAQLAGEKPKVDPPTPRVDLTPQQRRICSLLWSEGSALCSEDIATNLDLTLNRSNCALKRMFEMGLLGREPVKVEREYTGKKRDSVRLYYRLTALGRRSLRC